jgi:glycosyltransferase involved in cell wall biosynthesis
MKVLTVGITTYNREDYLRKTALSLLSSEGIEECHIRIYDDCSTQLSESLIKEIFPLSDIRIRKKNLGADENIRQMYENFLDTDDEILMNADADLLFRPDWLPFLRQHFSHTDGVLSLYNSNHHPAKRRVQLGNFFFLEKIHLGSAGTAFSRKMVEKIVKEMKIKNSLRLDWKWSEFLLSQGVRLLCSETSHIQHIGIDGQNSNGLDRLDYGFNFLPISETNEKFLVEFYEKLLQGGLKTSLEAMEQVRATKDFKLGSAILKYPRKIKNIIRNLN